MMSEIEIWYPINREDKFVLTAIECAWSGNRQTLGGFQSVEEAWHYGWQLACEFWCDNYFDYQMITVEELWERI
jgi:hypothetical protein